MSVIGDNLRRAREAMGWSIPDAIKRYGKSDTHANRIWLVLCESGEIEHCASEELSRLAEIYGRSRSWFFNENNPPDPPMLHCKNIGQWPKEGDK